MLDGVTSFVDLLKIGPAVEPPPPEPSPDGIECPKCGNKGYLVTKGEGLELTVRPCECMEKRRSLRILKESGLSDLVSRSTFKAFQTPDEWTRKCKETAWDYVKNGRGRWLYVSGRPGTGKTHICVAVCRQLIAKGASTRYMMWRQDAPRLKALVKDAEAYTAALDEYIKPHVLYIDDFFKQRGDPSDADVNLAFTILNARYNSNSKRTIISSELPLKTVRDLDEATASRIFEKARGYVLNAPSNAINWREK